LAVEDVDALLVGVDVRGDLAAGLELADAEAGVHRARVLVHQRPAPEALAGRDGVVGLRGAALTGPAHQVPGGHACWCCRCATCSTRWSRAASTSRRAPATSASSLPSRLWTLPPMITVSTLDTSALSVTAATG